MKYALATVFLIGALMPIAHAQAGMFQEGTVTRMRMSSCPVAPHRVMSALAGIPPTEGEEPCPEYTLLTNTVVYVVVGKTSAQLIPLAKGIKFRLCKNELVVQLDDSKRELSYHVREMLLRSDWSDLQAQRQPAIGHEESGVHVQSTHY